MNVDKNKKDYSVDRDTIKVFKEQCNKEDSGRLRSATVV